MTAENKVWCAIGLIQAEISSFVFQSTDFNFKIIINIMNNKYSAYLFFCIVLIGILYFFSISKDPMLGDSLVFNLQMSEGFIFSSNATNHILYTNFLVLLHKMMPFIHIHLLSVGVSILSGILCLFFLQKLLKVFDISDKSILMCILILGLSFTFWRVSVITEVYTFYILFVILFLLNLFKFLKSQKVKYFYYLSVFLGILFLIHIQTILFGPLYIYLIIKNYKILKQHIIYGGFITFSLTFILIIPVLMGKHGFTNIFTMEIDKGSIFQTSLPIVLKSFIRNSGFFIYNFLFFSIFIFFGLKNKTYLNYILIGIAPFLLFCLKHDVSDSYVFHLIPYVFLIILIGRGLDYFPKIYFALPILLPIFYFISFKIVEQTPVGENFEKEKGFKGGTRYMLFPMLNGNPDLDYFLKQYEKDSLYEKPELKAMHPLVLKWKSIEDNH